MRRRTRSGLPGTPALVEQARAVVSEHNRRVFRGLLAGFVVCAVLGAAALTVRSETAQLLLGVPATVAWVPALLGATMGGPDTHLVGDAQAVLRAWTTQRDEWAKAVLKDSTVEGAADVRAWSRAHDELRKMGQASTTRNI